MLWTTRIITAVIIVLGALAGLVTSPDARGETPRPAQAGDVRQEDRRADRRENAWSAADRSRPSDRVERMERSGSGDSGRH
jgi:hypothetical protein